VRGFLLRFRRGNARDVLLFNELICGCWGVYELGTPDRLSFCFVCKFEKCGLGISIQELCFAVGSPSLRETTVEDLSCMHSMLYTCCTTLHDLYKQDRALFLLQSFNSMSSLFEEE
jgi:hypothetical protein